MVRRTRPEPQPIEVRQFTRSEIDTAIVKLRRRIEDTRKLDSREVHYNDAVVKNVEKSIRETIREVFGSNSPELKDHEYLHIWHGGINLMDSDHQRQAKFSAGIPQTVTILEGLISRLEEKREDLAAEERPKIGSSSPPSVTRQVFVVHGRDEGAKETIARFLEKLRLEPIILHEQPNLGRTIIEKFEAHANVSFAVVLLTPDDRGHQSDSPDKSKARARQNVVLELGYFIARLGRSRVCALLKGDIETPSDIDGILYIPLDDKKAWQLNLAKEIKAAGVEVDLNDAM